MSLMTHLTAHPWIFSLESMLAVVNRSTTGLAYSTPREVLSLPCMQTLFIFLLLILRFPPTVLVNLGILFALLVMLLIMIRASHDPFRIAGEGHPKIILRYLFFFFRFYLWLLQKHEDLFWFIVYKGMFFFLDFGSWHGWSRDDSCHCVSNSKGKGNLLPTCTMPEAFYYFSF